MKLTRNFKNGAKITFGVKVVNKPAIEQHVVRDVSGKIACGGGAHPNPAMFASLYPRIVRMMQPEQ